MAKITKTSKTFRLPDETIEQLEEIGKILKENDTNVVVRAIGRLYAARESVLEEDIQLRRSSVKPN